MPYTPQHLKQAIDSSNFSLVKEIINAWQQEDTLSVNLNNKRDYFFLGGNALLYALYDSKPSECIIKFLIELKTKEETPVIDINETIGSEQSAMSILLDRNIFRGDEQLACNLLKLLLDQYNGEKRILDLRSANTNNHLQKPLLFAASERGITVLATLLSISEGNTPVLDCNEIIVVQDSIEKRMTLLDKIALNKKLSPEEKNQQDALVREAGGLKFQEIRLRNYEQRFLALQIKPEDYSEQYELAEATIAYVKEITVLGAVNRPEDVKKNPFLKKYGVEARIGTFSQLARAKSSHCKDRTIFAAFSLLQQGTGCCGEQTALALLDLLRKGIFDITQLEVKSKENPFKATDNHALLMISLPHDYSDFSQCHLLPDSVIVVDPWDNTCYPAKEFAANCDKLELDISTTQIIYSFLADGLSDLNGAEIDCSNSEEIKLQVGRFLKDNRVVKDTMLNRFSFWQRLTEDKQENTPTHSDSITF